MKSLEFSYYRKEGGIVIRVHSKSIAKYKKKLKDIASRSNVVSMEYWIYKLLYEHYRLSKLL
jgi:hypothetical protein